MSGSQGVLTYGQLLTQARTILQDQTTPYRYQDAELYFALTEAMADARRIRPDLFLVIGLDAAPQFISASFATTTFPLAWQYAPAFIDYIIARAEMRDDTFADDSRSAQLTARFTARMSGMSGAQQ